MTLEQCGIQVQDLFGPQVSGCYDNFDFTLLFEEGILYLAPLAVAVLLVPFRFYHLRSSVKVVRNKKLWILKQLWWATCVLLQLVHLIISLALKTATTRLTNAAIVAGLLATVAFLLLSHREHYYSSRPSTILSVYLLGSIILDAARARTLFGMPDNRVVAGIFIAVVCCKSVILALEAKEKDPFRNSAETEFSPEQKAGILNRAYLWWFNPLLLTGSKQNLTVETLLPIDDDIAFRNFRDRNLACWAEVDAQKPHALLKFLLITYKWPLLAGVPPRLCLIGLNYAQPFLIQRIVSFMGQASSPIADKIGYGLIAAYAIVYFSMGVITTMTQIKTSRAIHVVRGSLLSLVYHHTLRLNSVAVTENASLTLLNVDVERVGLGMRNMHEIWASLVELSLAIWLMEMRVGVASVAAVMVVLISILVNVRFGMALSGRQKIWVDAIQTRLTTTVAALGTMKGIKMTGAIQAIKTIITGMRAAEITLSKRFRRLQVGLVTISYFSNVMVPIFSFGTYSVLASVRSTTPLSAATAYPSLTVFALLSQAIVLWFDGIIGLVQVAACCERVRGYLASTVRIDFRNPASPRNTETTEEHNEKPDDDFERDNHSPNEHGKVSEKLIEIRKCSSSWDKPSVPTISDIDLTVYRGALAMVIGPVGCGKSTLLKAILGETPYNTGEIRVEAHEVAFCEQTAWLTNASVRDNIIGAGRFDPDWYNQVVRACALDQDFPQLPDGERSIIGSKGIVLSGGQKNRVSLARAVYSGNDLIIMDDVFAGLDLRTDQQVFSSLFGRSGILRKRGTTTVLATSSIRNIAYADYIVALGEEGTIIEQGTYGNLAHAGGYLESLKPQVANDGSQNAPDDQQELISNPAESALASLTVDDKRIGDLTVYKYYIGMIGWIRWWLFVFLACCFVFFMTFPQIWVTWWVTSNEKGESKLAYYLPLYALWGVLALLTFVMCCWHFVLNIVPRAAKEFHGALLDTVLSAPLKFFTSTDVGEISNRFSRDLELIDLELPISVIGTTVSLLSCLAQLGVIVYGSVYTAAAIPGIVVTLYFVQRFYLKTSRQLRLLEIEAKAPLLSHFLESISGSITIRSFGWIRDYTARSYDLLERCQRPMYELHVAQAWLNLTLDTVVAFIAVILVTVAVQTRSSSGSLIGLALVNVVGFGIQLKAFIASWTNLEMSMGAIARVRKFTSEVENENLPGEDGTPPPGWPGNGSIKYDRVSAAYGPDADPVIKDISFTVNPGQKLAICGRTGSGKSTIISSLLRIVELRSGTITIDGANISTLPRQEVRSKLITLPQDPVFFHASIRYNLDISKHLPDEKLYNALQRVGLREVIQKQGGLDIMMSEDLLSHGQRQLMCLARAILQPGKILILDEATSSIDQHTETKILEIIRECFCDHTVICIAHRLHTIIDYDQIIILDNGCIIEQGVPNELASSQLSVFASLLNSTAAKSEDSFIDNGSNSDEISSKEIFIYEH